MKVLKGVFTVYFTAYNLDTYDGFVSGGERHFIEICKRMPDWDIYVLTTPNGRMILEKEGIRIREYFVVRVPFEKILCNSVIGLSIVYAMRIMLSLFKRNISRREFSLILSPSHFLHELATALFFKQNYKTQFIVYLHHIEPAPLERMKYHGLLPSILVWLSQFISLKILKEKADCIFTCPSVVGDLIKRNIPENKIQMLYNGITPSALDGSLVFGNSYDGVFLGRLTPLKGIFELPDIWAAVCARFPRAKLAIIGHENKAYLDALREKIRAAKMENNVEILGILNDDYKYSVLKASKVFLAPSHEEGWGISVCEALACGLPVVAYDLPAYDIFGNYLVKVRKGDRKKFGDCVCVLLSSEEKRRRWKDNIQAVREKFDWDFVSKREIGFFQRFLS